MSTRGDGGLPAVEGVVDAILAAKEMVVEGDGRRREERAAALESRDETFFSSRVDYVDSISSCRRREQIDNRASRRQEDGVPAKLRNEIEKSSFAPFLTIVSSSLPPLTPEYVASELGIVSGQKSFGDDTDLDRLDAVSSGSKRLWLMRSAAPRCTLWLLLGPTPYVVLD
jgi:hypothetical protein